MTSSASTSDIARIFELQGRNLAAVRATTAADRIAKLERLRTALQARAQEAVLALISDVGKPPFEAAFDFGATFSEIDLAVANLAEWMKPEDRTTGPYAAPGATAQIIHEPKGRVLIFGPWNFPSSLLFQPLVGAIAAGNAVILKPSEMAPATAAVAAAVIAEVFDPSEVALFEGGVEVAEALLDLPFDHIFFTGSTKVGRRVMAAAARHLSSVTLELGGKCPAVIDADYDLTQAAGRIAWGKFLNAGQICLAPDHVWIAPQARDGFVAAMIAYLKGAYYPDGVFSGQDLARIIDARNLARVRGLLDDAVARGARVVFGGGVSALQMEPTLVVDVPRDCDLMREEIFAPILPVMTYDGQDDLLDQLNSRDKPLALYVFSDTDAFVEGVVSRTNSGGVTINDVIQHAAEASLPFGGVGASGMGAYHGVYSFREMSHARAVYRQAQANPMEGFIRPPYGDRLPG